MTTRRNWLRKPKYGLTVVFIHGINSSEQCWESEQGISWPELLKQEAALEDLGIYSFSYRTGFNTGSYSLSDIVDSLNEHLSNLDQVLNSDRVIFVCHSMGGIVARRFIVREQSNLIAKGIQNIGLFLVASPSLGAEYANMLSLLSAFLGHTQASALRFSQNNVWLNDLDKDFINLKETNRINIFGKELIEDLPLKISRFLGLKKQIVEPFSGARYFGQSFKVPGSDHISISKPEDKDAIQHRLLVEFIKKNYIDFANQISPDQKICNIPRSGVIEFIGRNQKLNELHCLLTQENSFTIVAIVGMAGIGKTELALQYAQKYVSYYPGGQVWLDSKQDLLLEIINACISLFNLDPPKDLSPKQKSTYFWSQFPEDFPVLIIVDNLKDYEELKTYLPINKSKFRILFTSRVRPGRSIKHIDISVLNSQDALKMLMVLSNKKFSKEDETIGKAICDWLGNLPLAIELLGRYLYRRNNTSLEMLKVRLESEGLKANPISKADQDMTNPVGISQAFSFTWETLSTEEKKVAYLVSLFSQDLIPWDLVVRCIPNIDREILEDMREDSLVNAHFLTDRGSNNFQYHQLIRRFIRNIGSKEISEPIHIKTSVVKTLVQYSKNIPELISQSLSSEILLIAPHLEEAIRSLISFVDADNFIEIHLGLGRFYSEKGLYERAKGVYSACLSQSIARFGSNNINTVKANYYLAVLHYQRGMYLESEEQLQGLLVQKEILKIDTKLHINILNSLGLALKERDRFPEARSMYEKALQMARHQYGPKHPEVSDILNNLALLYDEGYGEPKQAESLFLEALEIRKEFYGENHIKIANVYNSIGYCYFFQDRLPEAENKFQESLKIYREFYGENEHRDIAISLNNLAHIYLRNKDYKSAKDSYSDALEIQNRILGDEHPETSITINNLATVFMDLGEINEAESLYKKALKARKNSLGTNHSDYAISLNNLGKLYQTVHKNEKARLLFRKALKILENQPNVNQRDYQRVKKNFDSLDQ